MSPTVNWIPSALVEGQFRPLTNILDASKHQGRQGIVDHRLVVDRQQLHAGHHGEWIKPSADENNAFQLVFPKNKLKFNDYK